MHKGTSESWTLAEELEDMARGDCVSDTHEDEFFEEIGPSRLIVMCEFELQVEDLFKPEGMSGYEWRVQNLVWWMVVETIVQELNERLPISFRAVPAKESHPCDGGLPFGEEWIQFQSSDTGERLALSKAPDHVRRAALSVIAERDQQVMTWSPR
jgi:hypothetical protein